VALITIDGVPHRDKGAGSGAAKLVDQIGGIRRKDTHHLGSVGRRVAPTNTNTGGPVGLEPATYGPTEPVQNVWDPSFLAWLVDEFLEICISKTLHRINQPHPTLPP
jgi:hypothetical protein